jgi:hypothetical protein
VKEVLGTLSRAGWEGGSGKMARVGGRIGLSTITRYHLVGVFGAVRRTRAKEGMRTISRAGREAGSGNLDRVGGREGIGIIASDLFV